MKETTKRFAVGAVLAAAVGYVTGLLTAPKSGKETRQDIKEGTSKAITAAEKELKKLHTQLNETIDSAKKQMSKVNGRAREEMENALDTAGKAKQKAREILSAVHEGDAADADLNKAVSDATKALKNLKTYLTK